MKPTKETKETKYQPTDEEIQEMYNLSVEFHPEWHNNPDIPF